MKKKLLALVLLAGGSMFAQTRFSFSVGVGGPTRGYYYTQVRPPCPGPDYMWVDGYWAQSYGRRAWVPGYWNYVAPRYGYRNYRHEGDRYRGRNTYYNEFRHR